MRLRRPSCDRVFPLRMRWVTSLNGRERGVGRSSDCSLRRPSASKSVMPCVWASGAQAERLRVLVRTRARRNLRLDRESRDEGASVKRRPSSIGARCVHLVRPVRKLTCVSARPLCRQKEAMVSVCGEKPRSGFGCGVSGGTTGGVGCCLARRLCLRQFLRDGSCQPLLWFLVRCRRRTGDRLRALRPGWKPAELAATRPIQSPCGPDAPRVRRDPLRAVASPRRGWFVFEERWPWNACLSLAGVWLS